MRITVGLLALTVLILMAPEAAAKARRPNIVWIIADDLRADAIGPYGCKHARTPNLDALARAGTRFDRAYTNCPLCTPSRNSFLTSRYPRSLGTTQLGTPLPEGEATLAILLAAHGYHTAAIGKMHFNSPLTHGFALRLDHPDHKAALKARGVAALPRREEVLPPWRPFKDHARTWLNGGALPFAARDEDMAGTWFARRAAEYIRTRKKGEPFFLIASFYEPHSPFHFPVEFRGRHDPAKFSAPRVGPEDGWQIPAIFRDLTDREKQGILASYHTSVEYLDRNVGIVLDALREAGLEEDTIVVFFSDHGYMLGEHGRFEKHCLFEPAVRVPFIVRAPGRVPANQRRDALVQLLDIAPTCLQAAGVPASKKMQGKSLWPVLGGEARAVHERVFVEYAENEEGMVVEGKWRLFYGTGKRQRQDGYDSGQPLPGRTVRLYDMEKDPGQLTNLAGLPANARVVEALTARLVDHLRLTAREPGLVPRDAEVHAVLDHCLQPRDVLPPQKKGK